MRRRLTAGLIVAIVALTTAGTAQAAQYVVTGGGDAPSPPQCVPDAGGFSCTTLRAAVFEANATAGDHAIIVLAPAVTLTAGPLNVLASMTVSGVGARQTTVSGGGAVRVLAVDQGADVVLSSMTISDGFSTGTGGNIFVGAGASLSLVYVRVTGGRAINGAGITNNGSLTVLTSLLDDNASQASGGAIYNNGSDSIAEVTIFSSTLAGNAAPTGAAIYSAGSAQNEVQLVHATVGRNLVGSGIEFSGSQISSADGSIFASNAGPNCAGATFAGGTGNVDSGSACGLAGAGNLQNLDAGLASSLSTEGATTPTDVLTIPPTSPAIDFVSPCVFGLDQRGWLRTATVTGLEPCDAGAFELSGIDPGGQPPPPQPPPPPPPVPTPTPIPTPAPTPTFNQRVVVEPVRGTVLVCLVRQKCRELKTGESIPLGSTVDTKKGTVELTSLPSRTGQPQKARFFDGIFTITQSGSITDLTLTEPLAPCGKRARAAQRKPKSRKLWGDGKGKFRTKGKYSAATIRGTKWLIQDSCAGTLTRVTQGTVTVRDNVLKKTIVLRKGKRYVARPR